MRLQVEEVRPHTNLPRVVDVSLIFNGRAIGIY